MTTNRVAVFSVFLFAFASLGTGRSHAQVGTSIPTSTLPAPIVLGRTEYGTMLRVRPRPRPLTCLRTEGVPDVCILREVPRRSTGLQLLVPGGILLVMGSLVTLGTVIAENACTDEGKCLGTLSLGMRMAGPTMLVTGLGLTIPGGVFARRHNLAGEELDRHRLELGAFLGPDARSGGLVVRSTF